MTTYWSKLRLKCLISAVLAFSDRLDMSPGKVVTCNDFRTVITNLQLASWPRSTCINFGIFRRRCPKIWSPVYQVTVQCPRANWLYKTISWFIIEVYP